jgi:hypothetical protein
VRKRERRRENKTENPEKGSYSKGYTALVKGEGRKFIGKSFKK